jgi:hypothetical protein
MMKRTLYLFFLIPVFCFFADIYPFTKFLDSPGNVDVLFAFLLAATALLSDAEAYVLIFTWGFCLDAVSGVPLHMISLFLFRYLFRVVGSWFYDPYSPLHIIMLLLLTAIFRLGVFVAFEKLNVLYSARLWAEAGMNAGMDAALFLVFLFFIRRSVGRRRARR